jgi:hypothetical protein
LIAFNAKYCPRLRLDQVWPPSVVFRTIPSLSAVKHVVVVGQLIDVNESDTPDASSVQVEPPSIVRCM